MFEAGTRTPAMFHSPLSDAKGEDANGIFHITDWHATIMSIAGVDGDQGDGLDQSGMLFRGFDSVREIMVYNIDSTYPSLYGAAAIRLVWIWLLEISTALSSTQIYQKGAC